MNTCTIIKNLSAGQVGFRKTENQRNGSNYKNGVDIDILFSKDTPAKKELPPVDKKERHKIQKKIKYYEKIGLDILTPKQSKKYEHLKTQLVKTDGKMLYGKSEFIELTFSLTNSGDDKSKHRKTLNLFATEAIQKAMEDLGVEVISVVSHYDQNSPHFHLIAKVPPGQTWSNLLRERYQEKNTKEIYKRINNSFHDGYSKLCEQELRPMQSGNTYRHLKSYGVSGNERNKEKDMKLRAEVTRLTERNSALKSDLKQYQEIGTPKELKTLKSHFQQFKDFLEKYKYLVGLDTNKAEEVIEDLSDRVEQKKEREAPKQEQEEDNVRRDF